MYEFDFLPVGEGERSGDAITARFTHPVTGANVHVVIDAGFERSGESLIEHVKDFYGTDVVDLALLTHPDGDHIGGMGKVIRGLRVRRLGLHHLAAHGGRSLRASPEVDDLIAVAQAQGTEAFEPFTGAQFFGGAVTILSPTEAWYEELVAAQVAEEASRKAAAGEDSTLLEAASRRLSRLLKTIGIAGFEIPFDDKGGPGPRNNSSLVTLFKFDDGFRGLLTADAGVAALGYAWDYLEASGVDSSPPDFVQIPHHGSRKNGASDLLDRMLGPTGQPIQRQAYVSVVANSDIHPSAKIWNAYYRRGYDPHATQGRKLWRHSPDAPARWDYTPLQSLGPLDESGED
jgi:beta-lactamase superfamily II metal-dependent hydrolase